MFIWDNQRWGGGDGDFGENKIIFWPEQWAQSVPITRTTFYTIILQGNRYCREHCHAGVTQVNHTCLLRFH